MSQNHVIEPSSEQRSEQRPGRWLFSYRWIFLKSHVVYKCADVFKKPRSCTRKSEGVNEGILCDLEKAGDGRGQYAFYWFIYCSFEIISHFLSKKSLYYFLLSFADVIKAAWTFSNAIFGRINPLFSCDHWPVHFFNRIVISGVPNGNETVFFSSSSYLIVTSVFLAVTCLVWCQPTATVVAACCRTVAPASRLSKLLSRAQRGTDAW